MNVKFIFIVFFLAIATLIVMEINNSANEEPATLSESSSSLQEVDSTQQETG